MVKLIKALFAFGLLILLSILLFTTFFAWEPRDQVWDINDEVEKYQKGYYSFSGSQLDYLGESVEKSPENIYLEKISRFDRIYSQQESGQDYSIEKDNIALWKWLYILDLSDPLQSYSISGTSFEIELLAPGKIFIDSRNISASSIVSLTASFKLIFKDRQDNSQITELYIYPNRILSFNVNRLSELKNTDFLRVSQVLDPYNYINDSLYSSQQLSSKLTGLLNQDAGEFLSMSLSDISSTLAYNTILYTKLSNTVVWSFPGFDYISEKMGLFKNDQKKKIFYKNIVLDDLNKLFKSQKRNSGLSSSILENLNLIQALDPRAYDTMLEIIDYYGYLVFSAGGSEIQKQNLVQLISKRDKKTSAYMYEAFHRLWDMYREYNFLEWVNVIQDIPGFSELFFTDVWIELENNSISSIETQDALLLDYMSSHINEIIIASLWASIFSKQELSSDTLRGLLSIINVNNPLQEYIYFNSEWTNDDRKLTGLERNYKMIDFLAIFIKKRLFEDARSARDLLIVEPIAGLWDVLSQLSDNVASIDRIYQENISLALANKSKLLGYDWVQTQLKEYFLALSNYELYKRKYEAEFKDVRDGLIFQDPSEETISKETFLAYISQFRWVNTSQVEVDIINEESYRVTNLYIQGSQVDFYLYPFSSNRVEDIYIDKDLQWKTYILDQREFDLEEKYESASGRDKDKYDFSRFFINTLFAEIVEPGNEFIIDASWNSESKSVIGFKNEKLLWEEREFDRVKTYLPLKWENVVVSENLDIIIDDALWISQETKVQHYAGFNSRYKFSTSDNQFEDVKITLYDRYTTFKKEKLLLWWAVIDVIWEIHIGDFNSVSQDFFASLDQLTSLYTTLDNSVWASDISISYNVANKNIWFSFNLSWDSYDLDLLADTINTIKKNWKTVADNVKPSTLANVLNTLP